MTFWLRGRKNQSEQLLEVEALADFQRLLHAEYSSRREAVDQRALLLSGIAIGQVAAIVAFGKPLTSNYPDVLKELVAATAFVLALIGAAFTLKLVLPIRRKRLERRTAVPESLTWFFDVATYDPKEFHSRLAKLSRAEVAAEVAKLNVSVAKLLSTRYRSMIRAGSALSVSLWFTVGVVALNAALPYLALLFDRLACIGVSAT